MNTYFAVPCLLALAAVALANPPATLSYVPITTVDKVSDPSYKFNYAVNDPTTGDNKGQWETRIGDVVHGGYSLVEPDGNVRVVEYTADPLRGFNAVVKRTGPNVHSVALPVAAPITPIITKPIAAHAPLLHAPIINPVLHTAPLIAPLPTLDVLPLSTLHAPNPWVSVLGTKYGAKGNVIHRWATGPIPMYGNTLSIRTKH